MSERVLAILEVSQKQSYIFSSNKLRDNVTNSAVIAWIMSEEYFEETVHNPEIFSRDKNFVYSGGGHTVLEFADEKNAVAFIKCVTAQIRREYEGIEVFAVIMEYESKKSPAENITELIKKLEIKKAVRKSAFHQGSFGIEQIDANTLKPVLLDTFGKRKSGPGMPKAELEVDKRLLPCGFEQVFKFEELGGTKNDSNFIAVVHIDGNAMGKRVKDLYEKNQYLNWESFKEELRSFSVSVDDDFKHTYLEMAEVVADKIRNGELENLSLEKNRFPIRRIITAGDDICFVTEGRIGIECAALFVKLLNQKVNNGMPYASCAGVAIVHQKYPFYKAYELAEMLCSNAKKFGASLSCDGSGKDVSAIDWHIEFGEIKDTLDEIRSDYQMKDGGRLEMRPYIVCASDEVLEQEKFRQYDKFKKLIGKMQTKEIAYARGTLKELRKVLKQGEKETAYFLKFHQIESLALECYQEIFVDMKFDAIGTGQRLERKVFVETSDGKKHSLLFDAIELLDTFISLGE